MKLIVALATLLSVFAARTALGEDNRTVSWPADEKAEYYFGNIYQENHVYRFRTTETSIKVPNDAIVEVVSVRGIGKFHWIRADYPSQVDEPAEKPAEVKDQTKPIASDPNEYTYTSEPINDPTISEVGTDFFEPLGKTEKDPVANGGKKVESEIFIATGGGFLGSQESLNSQGLVGEFNGSGVSYGLQAFADVYPGKPAQSLTMFSLMLDYGQFMTKSKTDVQGGDPVTKTNKNSAGRLRGQTFLKVSQGVHESLYIGFGISWEKLPFFEIINEERGEGKLTTKTSQGFQLLCRYTKKIGLGDLVSDLGMTPIGASVKSIFQTDLNFSLRSGTGDEMGYFVGLKAKFQKVRYLKECAETDKSACTFPKTEGYSIGPLIGVYGDF